MSDKPCGCHYEFLPDRPEFQISIHFCKKHLEKAKADHDGQAARRWKWPDVKKITSN